MTFNRFCLSLIETNKLEANILVILLYFTCINPNIKPNFK